MKQSALMRFSNNHIHLFIDEHKVIAPASLLLLDHSNPFDILSREADLKHFPILKSGRELVGEAKAEFIARRGDLVIGTIDSIYSKIRHEQVKVHLSDTDPNLSPAHVTLHDVFKPSFMVTSADVQAIFVLGGSHSIVFISAYRVVSHDSVDAASIFKPIEGRVADAARELWVARLGFDEGALFIDQAAESDRSSTLFTDEQEDF